MDCASIVKEGCGAHGQLRLLPVMMAAGDVFADGMVPESLGLLKTARSTLRYSFRPFSRSLPAALEVNAPF
jgi:hypothetical protein